MKKGNIDGPVAVIIFITLIILMIVFLYPILNPIFGWLASLSVILKLGLIIFVLLTVFVLIRELQPRSRF